MPARPPIQVPRRLDILMKKFRIQFENTNRKSAGLSTTLMDAMRGEVLFLAAFALDTPRAVVAGQIPRANYQYLFATQNNEMDMPKLQEHMRNAK